MQSHTESKSIKVALTVNISKRQSIIKINQIKFSIPSFALLNNFTLTFIDDI